MATSARFQLKRDTKINWDASTVKLQSGEPGWDITNKVLKIGDGNRLWNELSAVSGGGGGSSLTPLTLAFPTTTNVFDNDNTINIASSWISGTPPITNGKLVIQEISGSVPLYTLTPITFSSFSSAYQIILPNGTYFNYGSSYKVIAQTSTGAQIAETAYTTYQPNVTFSLGTPYVVSAKSIGVPYTYATNGPRIVGMKFKVYTTDQNTPIQAPTTVTIPRNYSGNTITTQQFVTYPSSYLNGTNYTIAAYYEGVGGSVPISSTTSELTYNTPSIISYTFSPNDNRTITVRMNNSANVTLSATYYTPSGLKTDKSTELINAQSSGDIYLSSYPAFGGSYMIRATFADNTASIDSFIEATSPLIFNKRGNILGIDFPQSATTNPGTFIPSLTFSNIFDNNNNASARLLITNTTNSSDTGTLIISNALNSGGNTPFSASGSGADTVYGYNGSLSYNFTYGQTYRFDLLNSDAAKYVFSSITIGPLVGTFQTGSAITGKKAGVSGLSLTVAGLSWTGIGFTTLPANIYTSTDASFTTSLGSGTYNTNNGSITVNLSGSNTFESGIMYVIAVTMPDGTRLKSQNSDPYVVTYIIRQPNSVLFSDRVPARFTWVESNAELAIWNYDNTTNTRTSQLTSTPRQSQAIGSAALNSNQDVDITLGGASFAYNAYYQLEVKYTTTSQTSFYSLPFQYVYDSFRITSGPTFPTSNSLNTSITSTGISGETRLFLSVYEITAATITSSVIAVDTPSVSTSLTNVYFDGATLTFSEGALQPVNLTSIFSRRNYYFAVIKFGTDDTGVELARSSTANLYNPSGISVTSVVNTGEFIGPSSIPVSLTIDGVTTGSSYYLQLRNSSNAPLNTTDGFSTSTTNAQSGYPTSVAGTLPTTITYTFPIEKLSNIPKTYSYYLFGALKPPSPATSIISRYPPTESTYFNYTYDSSIYSTSANRPTVSFDNDGKATFTITWKGLPTRAWPYLTNAGGTTILRRFQPIVLQYASTATTVTTGALSAYSGTYNGTYPSGSLLLPDRSVAYYAAFSLNGPPTSGTVSADTGLFPFPTEKISAASPVSFTPPFWEITRLNGVTSNTVTFALSFTGGYPTENYPTSNTFNVRIPNAVVAGNLFNGTITPLDNGTKTFTLTSGQTFAQSNAGTQTSYTFSIEQKLGLPTATFPFNYYPTVLASQTLVFENNSASSLYGNLNSSGTVQTSENVTLTLRLDLMKYDSSAPTTGLLISSQTLDFTQGQTPFTKLWTQDLFDLGSFYNVNYTITNSAGTVRAGGDSSDRFLSTNILYNPVGYDILVFIGQSNMAGRDNGTYYINALTTENINTPTEAVYPRKYEDQAPPQYTTAELNTPISDKNGNVVELVTFSGGIHNAPIPATATAFVSGHDAPAVNCVSQAYDFTKLYARGSFLRSNRRVAVAFLPRGGSGFVNNSFWYSRRGGPTIPGQMYTNSVDTTNSFRNINLPGTYSANRVVAIVMHQGEADLGRTEWTTRVDTTISDFIVATQPLSSVNYTRFLCGNLELLSYAAAIDISNNTFTNPSPPSGENAVITTAEQILLRNGFYVPNQIDSFPIYKAGGYGSDSFSSLGLTGMDIDPLHFTYPMIGSTFSYSTPGQANHFSSRSERLFGLRAYNAYARLNGKVASATEPSLATDSTVCVPPKTSTYNTHTNILTFASTANNSSFSANPIAYLLTYTSGAAPTLINWVVTEYCTYRSTIASGGNPTSVVSTNILSCAIPYNKYSSGSNILCSYPAGTATTLNIGGIIQNVNIYGARYSFPTSGEAYTLNYDANFAQSSVTPKPLSLGMNDLLSAITDQLDTVSKVSAYNVSPISITMKAIYSDTGVPPNQLGSQTRGMLLSETSYQLPPIVGYKLLGVRNTAITPSIILFSSITTNLAIIPSSANVNNWLITPTPTTIGGGGVPLLNTNVPTGGSGSSYLVIAGCPGTATTSAAWQGPTPQGDSTSYAVSTTALSASIINNTTSIVTVTIVEAAPAGVIVGQNANVGLSPSTTFSDGGATGIPANVLGFTGRIVGIANSRQTLSLLFPDRPNLSISLSSSGPGKVIFSGGQEINLVSSSNLSIIQGTSTLTLTLTTSPDIDVNTPVKITFSTGTLPPYSGRTNNRLQSTLNGIYYTIAGTAGNIVCVTVPGQIVGTFTPGSSATVQINSNVPGLTSTINSFSTTSAPYVTPTTYSIVGYPTSTLNNGVFTPIAFAPLIPTAWSHTESANNGFTYCRIVNGIDWALFFSASKYATTAMSEYTGRTSNPSCSVNSYQFCGIAPEIVGSTYSLLCPIGPTLESTLSGTGTLRPLFYYMYNTGCGFILNLRNVNALKTYTVSYYISTRAGRVPHNTTVATPTALINGVTTDIYLTNPLPIRVLTQIPTNIASSVTTGITQATAQIGQDVHFGVGTQVGPVISTTSGSNRYLTTSYLHPSTASPWNGSWKQMSFQFNLSSLTTTGVSVDGNYTFNHAFIRFGPLPMTHASGTSGAGQPEFIDTSINIAGISVNIVNP